MNVRECARMCRCPSPSCKSKEVANAKCVTHAPSILLPVCSFFFALVGAFIFTFVGRRCAFDGILQVVHRRACYCLCNVVISKCERDVKSQNKSESLSA